MVGQQDGLGPLHVGVARQVHVVGVGLGRPPQQDVHEVAEAPGHEAAFAADVEAQVECDLIVAAPAGVELGSGRAGQFGDAALDGGVDVLVEREERERPRRELRFHPGEGGGDHRPILFGDEPDPGQHVDMGPGPGQVVGRQPGVEREALGEVEQRLGGGVGEPSVPEGRALGRRRRLRCSGRSAGSGLVRSVAALTGARPSRHWPGPWRRAHVSTDRPHRRTKPSASRWRNVSEAS